VLTLLQGGYADKKIMAFFKGEPFGNETLTTSTLERFNDQQNHLGSYSVPENSNTH